jgi:hypothetical protein
MKQKPQSAWHGKRVQVNTWLTKAEYNELLRFADQRGIKSMSSVIHAIVTGTTNAYNREAVQ